MIQLLTAGFVRRPQKDDARRRIRWYTKDLSFRSYTFTEEEYADKELVAAKMEAVATECPPLNWIIHLDWGSVPVEKPKGAPRGTKDRKFYQRNCRYKEPFLEFEAQSVSLNPYFLGLWLGDGTSRNTTITTMDSEVSDWICEYAEHLGLTVTVSDKRNNANKAKGYAIVGRKGTNENRVRMWLRDLQLEKTEKDVDTKHIPVIYLQNSVDVRTQVLAGLIDSDGYKTSTTTYEIFQKNTQLANDIVSLTRSLGFYTRIDARKKTCQSHDFEGDYWSIRISIDQTSPKLPIRIPKKQFLGSE